MFNKLTESFRGQTFPTIHSLGIKLEFDYIGIDNSRLNFVFFRLIFF